MKADVFLDSVHLPDFEKNVKIMFELENESNLFVKNRDLAGASLLNILVKNTNPAEFLSVLKMCKSFCFFCSSE